MVTQNEPVDRETGADEARRHGAADSPPLDGHPEGSGDKLEDLAVVRELALRAHPDTVPELVGGTTVAEIMASLEPARAAYRRAAEHAGGSAASVGATPAHVPAVPAGDAPRAVVDPDRLSAGEKIRRGLAERHGS